MQSRRSSQNSSFSRFTASETIINGFLLILIEIIFIATVKSNAHNLHHKTVGSKRGGVKTKTLAFERRQRAFLHSISNAFSGEASARELASLMHIVGVRFLRSS